MKKINVLIDATSPSSWMGGLYYKKNVVFSFLLNEKIVSECNFIIATEEKHREIYVDLLNNNHNANISVICVNYKSNKQLRYKLLLLSLKYNCEYIFPSNDRLFSLLNKKIIHWIPDFQHRKLPDFFSEEECRLRDSLYQRIANDNNAVILSSKDSYNDFLDGYHFKKNNVYVLHFVSYIEAILNEITNDYEEQVLKKYELNSKKYVCIMNQFWRHKNHIVVFKAIDEYFKRYPNDEFLFVFSGKLEDYRNPEYISAVKDLLNLEHVSKHVRMLGFMDRKEQLVVMKRSMYVIQPSLFEGWGTVVEDAKVLDKTILLSDISIHQEQKNEKCILFDPYNENDLVEKIKKENSKEHNSDTVGGIGNMYRSAKKYSKAFEDLLFGTN